MLNSFILFIIFEMSFATLHVSIDQFDISYSVSFENLCRDEKGRFKIRIGTSISQCVKECGARAHCQALNYRSRSRVCELFPTPTSDTSVRSSGNCVHVQKDDISVIQTPCSKTCMYGEVCESTGQGAGVCKINECVNVTAPDNGRILGNERELGKKIRYKCNKGFKEVNATDTAECLDTGKWSSYAECVKSPPPTIGEECTSNAECIETEGTCIEGKCFCNPLYRYNTSIEDCRKVCGSMSDDFNEIEQSAIVGFNKQAAEYDIPEDCRSACVEDPNCLSVEMWFTPNGKVKCTNGYVTLEMILDADKPIRTDFNGVLYSRSCNTL